MTARRCYRCHTYCPTEDRCHCGSVAFYSCAPLMEFPGLALPVTFGGADRPSGFMDVAMAARKDVSVQKPRAANGRALGSILGWSRRYGQ